MARVAALYDVHGNAPALKAVLEEVRAEGVELVVFGGDLTWGPFPREALELAMDPGVPALYVRGNGDREVALYAAEEPEDWVAELTGWTAARLDEPHKSFLLDQSESVAATVEGLGDVLFCHGSPRSDEEALTPVTPERRFRDVLAGVAERTVVCGHTHMQFDRVAGGVRVVNAGSVGMPYEGAPGAYWALLGPDVVLRRTNYDYDAVAAAVRASGCPFADDIAGGIIAPPSREEVQAQFEPSPE